MKSTCCRPGALLTALIFALSPALAQQSPSTSPAGAASASPAAKTFSQQDLDRLLAPIALYPDALLVQVLMASTYPLEVVEAARWAKANPKVTGKALEDAMAKQGLGSGCQVADRGASGVAADERQSRLDAKAGGRFSGPAAGPYGYGAAPACQGRRGRKPENHRTAGGHDRGAGQPEDLRRRIAEARGGIRADL
jgi:hypothetical protein